MKSRNLLKIFICLLLFITTNFVCAAPTSSRYTVTTLYEEGVYIGTQIGYIDPHNNKIHYSNSHTIYIPLLSPKTGGRIYAGYAFNDYYAVELGFNRLIHASGDSSHAYLTGYDAFAKFSWPFNIYFSTFAKIGAANLKQDYKNVSGNTVIYRKQDTRLLPAIAGGASFHLTTHTEILGTITHMFGHSRINSVTMYGLGIQYTFLS